MNDEMHSTWETAMGMREYAGSPAEREDRGLYFKRGRKAGRQWQRDYDMTGGRSSPEQPMPCNSVSLSERWARGFIAGAGDTPESRLAVARLLRVDNSIGPGTSNS